MERVRALTEIQNVVASASLGQGLELSSIIQILPSAQYHPETFPGLVYRLRKPRATALVFSSGKMVCAGASSERQARRAVTKVVDDLKANGIVIVGKPDIHIRNIVATARLAGSVDLEKATCTLTRTIYDPEQFPGLIYRMDDPDVVMLIFANGNLVCAGAKKEEEVHRAVSKVQETLEKEELIEYPHA